MTPTPSLSSQPVLAVVPTEVERAARDWDVQHLDLVAATRQVAGVPTAGFAPTVVTAADDFVKAWAPHLGRLADTAGSTAVALRTVTGSLLRTDTDAAARASWLGARLGDAA